MAVPLGVGALTSGAAVVGAGGAVTALALSPPKGAEITGEGKTGSALGGVAVTGAGSVSTGEVSAKGLLTVVLTAALATGVGFEVIGMGVGTGSGAALLAPPNGVPEESA